MWQAIQAAGRPMVLTVEGNPDDNLLSAGGYGNAKRVGHDIDAVRAPGQTVPATCTASSSRALRFHNLCHQRAATTATATQITTIHALHYML